MTLIWKTLWRNLYFDGHSSNSNLKKLPKFKVGDYVRITKHKHTFQKGYESNWSDEIFIITSVILRSPWVVYTLKDLEDESITGTFYEKELQKVTISPTSEYKIDKIIRYRKSGVRKEALVKWKGYPNKFNSWVLLSTIKKL